MRTANDTLRHLFTLLMLLALAGLPASAQDAEGQRLVVPLTDPSRPVHLEVALLNGTLSVEGYDGKDVIVLVRTDDEDGDHDSDERTDGLRRLPNRSIGVEVEEADNHVEIGAQWMHAEVDLKIRVPRRTSCSLSMVNGGDLVVEGVDGEHEIDNLNGDIIGRDLRGSVVANTTNGDLSIEMASVRPDKAMAFASFNGDVDVRLPAGIKADLKLNAGRGEIYTDFDVKLAPSAPKVERGRGPGPYRVTLEGAMEGTVGGGGPEFEFRTFNGDIRIRKSGN